MSKKLTKPEEENKLAEIHKAHEGDVYYSDSYNLFFKIDKTDKKGNYKCLQSRDGINWVKDEHHTYISANDIQNKRYYIKLHLAPGETYQQAIASLEKEMLDSLINPKDDEEDDALPESESKALMIMDSKTRYEEMALSLERSRARADIMRHMAEERIEQFRTKFEIIEKQLHKVMKIIAMLETYLGVYEEVFQLTEGQPASVEEPVSIRQLILYMDEEAGLVNIYHGKHGFEFSGFINFQNIDTFDKWLLEDNHIDIILPEKKGIIALKPSRQEHYKKEDFWSAASKTEADKMVYLLVRNGDNLYRICTEMYMANTLFPTLKEAEHIEKLFEESGSTWDREKAEKAQSSWLHNTMLIQGLFDRSSIFQPLPVARVELNNPDTFDVGGVVRLIRDAENVIGDGHLSFHEWRKKLNESVDRGSRIYFPGLEWTGKDTIRNRFPNVYSYNNNYPSFPRNGIYTIEEIAKGDWSNHYHFKYLPVGTIYTYSKWDGFEEKDRKKRYMFSVYSDEFINYDEFTVEDIEYFLNSRQERKDYLRLIPTLIGLREMRMAELEKENAFVKLLSTKHNIAEEKLWKLVDWWKKKVINKRPLSKDDAKAWRMIVKKAKSENKKR